MHFVYFLTQILCSNISYKINRISKVTDTSAFEYITTKKNYSFYEEKVMEKYEALPLPQTVNKLAHMDELKLKKKESLYLIKPFEYIKVVVNNETQSLGYFTKLRFEQKNVVCYYTDGLNIKSKVMFIFNENEAKIEKFFAGEISMFVFKVSGNFLGDKRDCRVMHYFTDDLPFEDNLSKIEAKINYLPSFLEQIRMNLTDKYVATDKYVTTDTEEKREEL